MNISPRRRRRIFREHELRQDGLTLEQIADQVDVSIATVHADLRLLEEHWSLVTKNIHDDLLLQQIARLDRRIERLNRLDPLDHARRTLGPDDQLSLDQLNQFEDRHYRRLAQAERELRMLLNQLHNPYITGDTRAGDYPDHELADPETDREYLKEPESPPLAIPRKTLEIVAPGAPKRNIAKTLKSTDPLPRNTGRNQLCPCGSGEKHKRCHPQPLNAPPLQVMRGSDGEDLPPELDDEALRLTRSFREAKASNDAIAQLDALDKLVDLYGK